MNFFFFWLLFLLCRSFTIGSNEDMRNERIQDCQLGTGHGHGNIMLTSLVRLNMYEFIAR